jgi:hypothetical protein
MDEPGDMKADARSVVAGSGSSSSSMRRSSSDGGSEQRSSTGARSAAGASERLLGVLSVICSELCLDYRAAFAQQPTSSTREAEAAFFDGEEQRETERGRETKGDTERQRG